MSWRLVRQRPGTTAPRTAVARIRLSALILASVSLLFQVVQLDPHRPLAHLVTALLSLVALEGCFVATYRRQSAPAWDWLVMGVAAAIVATALREPIIVTSLCTAAITNQLLYSSSCGSLRRVALLFAAPFVGVAFIWADSPAEADIGRVINTIGVFPAFAMAAVAVRGLYGLLDNQVRTTRRESVLSRSGSRFIEQTDLAGLPPLARQALTELCDLFGVAILIFRRTDSTLQVVLQVGFSPSVVGATVHLPGEPDLSRASHTALLDELVGEPRSWRSLDVPPVTGTDLVVLAGTGPVADDVVDAFRELSTQYTLAAARCITHGELVHLAHHDQLTGLDNRTKFLDRLAAARAERRISAVLAIDLNNFQVVNDIYGHETGDRLLLSVADLLRRSAGEDALVSRLGGDEFAVAVPAGVDPGQLAERLSERLQDTTTLPYATGSSIGIAAEEPSLSDSDLIRRADAAMYAAKAAGRNQIERFSPARHGDVTELRLIEQHLPTAAAQGEIVVHYQPHVDLKTRHCVGLEALARWQHPTLGLLPPGRFIPLAEQTGHIAGIGTHVLRVACRQAAEWSSLPGCGDLQVAVNVAAPQLYDPAFVDLVADALAVSGLPADRLTLELTESGMIDQDRARAQIDALVELGTRISIDDFGTGYASLATLHAITAHQVKIDRSFVSGAHRVRGRRMVQLIVAAGRILDLEIVAEGVETEQQAVDLERTGVPMAQGYHFARPMPAAEFPRWLESLAHTPRPVLADPSEITTGLA